MQIIITPKSIRSGMFLKKLLSRLEDVKSIELVEDKEGSAFFCFIRKFTSKGMEY